MRRGVAIAAVMLGLGGAFVAGRLTAPNDTRPDGTAPPRIVAAMGETRETKLGTKITVLSWSVTSLNPRSKSFDVRDDFTNPVVSAADIQLCAGSQADSDTTAPGTFFTLTMQDSSAVEALQVEKLTAHSGRKILNRVFTVAPGECLRGLLLFRTPKGEKPKHVVFESSSVIRWAVP